MKTKIIKNLTKAEIKDLIKLAKKEITKWQKFLLECERKLNEK